MSTLFFKIIIKNVIMILMIFNKEKEIFFVVLCRFFFLLLFVLTSFFSLPKNVFGADLVWTGLAGDAKYSTAGNWSPSKVPSLADNVTFDNTCTNCNATIDISTTTNSITLASTYTGTVSLDAGVDFNSAGGFTMAGGTFSVGSATLTLGSYCNFTKTGGTFNEGTGTVVFSPTWAAVNTYNIDGASAGSETFYNVIFNGGADNSTLTISSGDTIVVAGALTLTNGIVGTGYIDARGDINQAATFDGNNVTLDFGNDSASQTYTLNGGLAPIIRFDSTADASDSLVFNATTTLYGLTIASGFGANTVNTVYNGYGFTLYGGYTQAAGTFIAPNFLTFGDYGAFTKTGGTFDEGTGTVTFATGWNVNNIYNIDGASAGSETFYNVIFNGCCDGSTLTISSGDTIVVAGALTLTNGIIHTGTLEARSNVTLSSGYDGGTSPLIFSGSANQDFNLTGATGVFNGDITINKTAGEVNLLSALVMDAASQDLLIQSGTLDLNGNALTVNGSSGTLIVQNGGTLKLNGDEIITTNAGNPQIQTGGTVDYAGAGSYTLKGYTYSNLSITGAGSFTATSGPLTIGKNFTQSAGTFTASGATTTIAGNITRTAGTFAHNSGTVHLNGTSQLINDSTTFNNLYKVITSADTLTFEVGATTTIAGTLTMRGASGNLLSLISSSAGNYSYLDPQSTRYVDYLSVKDSYNSNATVISSAGHNITDAGNNVNWGFNQTPSVPSSLSPSDGSWISDISPTLSFNISDLDAGDTVRYQIQIDDTSNSFSSLIINYISALEAQGAKSFTVGQSAGTGAYVVGSESQTLPDSATYYWRVLTADNNNASSTYTTANSGSVAFKVDSTAPTAGDVSLSATSTTSFTATISGASDGGSGLSATPYIFYNTTNSTNSLATSSESWLSDDLIADTLYSFEVSVSDLAGNTSTTTSFEGRTTANPVLAGNTNTPAGRVGGHRRIVWSVVPVASSPASVFNRDLFFGLKGDDVRRLQSFLVSQNIGPSAKKLKANGVTNYFGSLTREALIEYQKKNKISPAVGYFGPITRAFIATKSVIGL
ncbi:MAG: hypothetical protein WC657_01750 [Candidatus Paceibacterota bacterium]